MRHVKNEGFTVPSFVDQSSPELSLYGVQWWEIAVVLLVFVVLTLLGRLLFRLFFK